MSRWIDADALKQNINTAFWSEIGKIIDDAPSIDIVRCKECKYYKNTMILNCRQHLSEFDPDDFCSYGERSECDERWKI